jgi:tRNA(adenine34) deaminase
VTITAPATEADNRWMALALREAAAAGARGEVPVGAVIVDGDRMLACAGNASVGAHDPAGHAEIRALRTAAAAAANYRLSGATLYVTIEPCVMCMGAALQARLARIVYGCADPKGGAAVSLYDLGDDARLNHRIAVTAGVAEEDCRRLLQEFFRARRDG